MLALALLTIAAPIAATPADDTLVIDRIVAVVNKNVVLESEVEGLLDQMMQADPVPPGADAVKARAARKCDILDELVAEKLLDDEVKKLRIDVTDAEIDRVVQGTMQEHGLDEAKLKMALARQGLTLDEYREGLKKQLTKMKIIQLKVKNRVQITDQDVEAKKNQQKILSSLDYHVKARHILFVVPPGDDGKAAKAKAVATLARLEKGEDFAAVAKEVSEDPGTKDRGGDLGEFGRGEMVPEFEKAAFTADVGKLIGPVHTAFGWHIIRVDARVAAPAKTDKDAGDAIRTALFNQAIDEQFRQYVEELKRDAHIDKRICSAAE